MQTRHLLCLAALNGLLALATLGCTRDHPASVPESTEDAATDGSAGPASQRHARIERILEPLTFHPSQIEVDLAASPAGAADAARVALAENQRELDAGRRVEALEHAVRAVVAAGSAEAFEALGRTLRTLGRSSQALAAFRTASHLEPDRSSALAEMASTLDRLARRSEAIAAWQDVLALDAGPGSAMHAKAHARLAVSYYYLGDPETAREHQRLATEQGASLPQLERLLRPGHSPAPSTRGGAGAIVVGPMTRLDSGGTTQAVETSVVISESNPLEMVAAWNDLREPGTKDAWSLGVGLSQDGGATWNDFLLRAPGATVDNFEGDPMTAYDPRTGNIWVGGVTFFPGGNIFVARKAPGAAMLEPVVVINDDNNFDKGWMAAGPAPGDPNSTRLYVGYNLGLQTSADLGQTWSPVQALDLGIAQQPLVGPGGELYIGYWDFQDGVKLQRSFDGGATISPPVTIAQRLDFWDTQDGSRFPGRFRVPPLNYLAVDPNDGTLYCVYFDTTGIVDGQANVDLYFTRSLDRGDTWTPPQVINGDSDPPGDQFFPWLEVDATGRLHLLYLDTRHTPQLDDAADGLFDAYYATSVDGGDSWIEARLTPASFSSSAATWPGFEQFLGDFVGLSVAGDTILAVYPATINGDLDIFAQRIELADSIFADDFESGDTSRWQ